MERRNTRRFSVVNLDLFDSATEEKVGQIVNISQGGMLSNSEQSYEKGKDYSFYIPFKETVNGVVKFEFLARIIWCRPNAMKPGPLSIGLEFSDNPKIQTLFIEQMIKIYSRPDIDAINHQGLQNGRSDSQL